MKFLQRILDRRHKNNKLLYYLTNLFRQLIPGAFFRNRLHQKLSMLSHFDQPYVLNRVNYYNKLRTTRKLNHGIKLAEFKLKKESKVYFFDTYEYTRYFNPQLRIRPLFGDITFIPEEPCITKSRPVAGDNANSVILKLNKVRHFIYTRDRKAFEDKKNMLVGRGRVVRVHRVKFFEMYFNHPLCDIGQTTLEGNADRWLKNKLTIEEQMDYKFILCLEGNDVASNLKWVMSSNSIAVMPKPRYETWFMEGTLIPDHHYIAVRDDYADLEEKLKYFIANTAEALRIVQNANEYVRQFKNKTREDLISLLVLHKYFNKTGQIEIEDPTRHG